MRALRLRFALGLALAAALALAVSALAVSSVRSTVSIQFHIFGGRDGFQGTVKSSNHRCIGNRRVVVYGVKRGYTTKKFKTHSNASGKWKVLLPYKVPPGRWYARALRKQVGSVVCAAARSKSLLF